MRPIHCWVLIESDWNLKLSACICELYHLGSINRIRLEFKVEFKSFKITAHTSINRIRLEFKVWMTASHRAEELSINRIRLEFKDDVEAVMFKSSS